jgi:DNA (cytosine-5)-methyltransferase 1
MAGLPLFGWRRRYWNFLLKLAKNRPAWTVQAQPGPATGPFHWENRLLSRHELAALQTFPSDAIIIGNRADAQRQLGNAVPSLLAEVVARSVRSQLLDGHELSGPPTLLPARQLPMPAPEPVMDVPEKYLSLIGKHKPHPGTGRGALYGQLDEPVAQFSFAEL